ncbi:PSP1 domain-containing protein [Maridesulfovibrio zosterae]|uniref:PSP1 domain-containing protein n=1 Tax=Maridesulfovibrio zosterae TaxID=82171 RepID=UPI00040BBE52|nr:regulatory iron-sulfur-containing complex subunit RicT [Maridesulfovibrio zosterae]
MSQILGVKFNDFGQIYYFSSGPFVVREGHSVLVKTEQGMGLGRVSVVQQDLPEDVTEDSVKTIYRLAGEEDLTADAENRELARAAHKFCKNCIDQQKLEMKLVDVEVFFDRSKIIFYFTAPGRIDFRELVKDLVKEYRTRIELRQIGVRHETQMLGAIGNCGQICCCRRFMRKFMPVTIRMAKEQNLFLNPTKISGICGRLLCCLSFEQENYEQFHKKCPKIGKRYNTIHGSVRVTRTNFFSNALTVAPEKGDEIEISLDDWPDVLRQPSTESGGTNRSRADLPNESSTDFKRAKQSLISADKESSPRPRHLKPGVAGTSSPEDNTPLDGSGISSSGQMDSSTPERGNQKRSDSVRSRSDRPKLNKSRPDRSGAERKKRPIKPKGSPQHTDIQSGPATDANAGAIEKNESSGNLDKKPSSKGRRPSRRRRRKKPSGPKSK